ncbi:MAG TPA: glycosyltransferase family 4 protein [Saprospiraceae bacterium]|nr:glycosyltransferase family 4 protein [Saprospiraceae bacterium]
MKKILFISDNFPPEVNAPASRTFEHCKHWVNEGYEITVITSAPNFPSGKVFSGYRNRIYSKELIDGIHVIRVWSYITANEGFIKRTLDYISFAFSSLICSLFIKTDLIIATSPQFFVAISGCFSAFLKRKPWIMEVRDLWPESIAAVGAIRNKKILKILEWIELRLYRSAKHVIVVTNAFKNNICSRGIPENKISVIKNGVDLSAFLPTPKDTKLIEELRLQQKFVVAYFGTHGLAHQLDFIIRSSIKINDPEIHLLFIGNGAEKNKLKDLVKSLQCNNVTMLDSVPKSQMIHYISIIDVALVNLKKSETFKTVIPSKIFENAAMQKPILLGVEGESKEIIEHYQAGLCFEPESETDFLEKLYTLKNDQSLYALIQQNCLTLAHDYNREALALQMLKILDEQSSI